MTPGTLVTVFGTHPGVVIAPGKTLPKDPENWVRVEWRNVETGTRINSFVELKEVKERK